MLCLLFLLKSIATCHTTLFFPFLHLFYNFFSSQEKKKEKSRKKKRKVRVVHNDTYIVIKWLIIILHDYLIDVLYGGYK